MGVYIGMRGGIGRVIVGGVEYIVELSFSIFRFTEIRFYLGLIEGVFWRWGRE